MTDQDSLPLALLRAKQAFKQPGKTGRNTSQGWAFVEAGAVLTAAETAFTDAGLVAVFAEIGDFDPHLVHLALTVTHPLTGEVELLPVRWPVDRAGPQARRAALSYAMKQILVGLFLVGDSDPETHAQAPEPPVRASQRWPVDATDAAQGSRAYPRRSDAPTESQTRMLLALLSQLDIKTREERLDWARSVLSRDLESFKDLDRTAVSVLINRAQFEERRRARQSDPALSEPMVGEGEDLPEMPPPTDS